MFGPKKLYLIRIYHMRFSDFFNNKHECRKNCVRCCTSPTNKSQLIYVVSYSMILNAYKTTKCVIPDALVYYLICMCLIKSKALYRCFKLQQEQ